MSASVRSADDPAGQALLQARARRLAEPPPPAPDARRMLALLEFEFGHGRYAIEAAQARAVHALAQLIPLPGLPPFMRGIVNLHGRLVAVIDLARFLGLPARGLTDLHRVIVVGDDDAEIGLLAGPDLRVTQIDPAAVLPPPALHAGAGAAALRGLAPDATAILDPRRILADPRLRAIAEADGPPSPDLQDTNRGKP